MISQIAYGKRTSPPVVEPVISNGISYLAPNHDGSHAYVEAWNAKTHEKIWEIKVFSTSINPLLEADVQWIFIKRIAIDRDKLIVETEDRRIYAIDLKSKKVSKLSKQKN